MSWHLPFTGGVLSSIENVYAPISYIYKLIVVGDECVGKSCLMMRFTQNSFSEEHSVTVGVDFFSKTVSVDGKAVKVQCWDTAGQERFRSIVRSYFRGAAGALVVYDITDRSSFDHVVDWVHQAREHADPDITITLLGNKLDKSGQRQVSRDEGTTVARRYGLIFFEASAKTGEHVEAAFMATVDGVYRKTLINDTFKYPSSNKYLDTGVIQVSDRYSSKFEEEESSCC